MAEQGEFEVHAIPDKSREEASPEPVAKPEPHVCERRDCMKPIFDTLMNVKKVILQLDTAIATAEKEGFRTYVHFYCGSGILAVKKTEFDNNDNFDKDVTIVRLVGDSIENLEIL